MHCLQDLGNFPILAIVLQYTIVYYSILVSCAHHDNIGSMHAAMLGGNNAGLAV